MDHTTQFLFIPRIAQCVCLLLGIKAVIALVAYCTISGTPILERKNDQDNGIIESLRATAVPWYVVKFIIFIWLNILWDSGRSIFGAGIEPASSEDQYWLAGILVWQNALHVLLNVRMLLESNVLDAWAGGRRWAGTGLLILYTVGLHQLISSWLSIRIVQRYDLESLVQPTKPQIIAFQDTFSSFNVLYSAASSDQPAPMFLGFLAIVFSSMLLPCGICLLAATFMKDCFIPLCCCCTFRCSEGGKDEEEDEE